MTKPTDNNRFEEVTRKSREVRARMNQAQATREEGQRSQPRDYEHPSGREAEPEHLPSARDVAAAKLDAGHGNGDGSAGDEAEVDAELAGDDAAEGEDA